MQAYGGGGGGGGGTQVLTSPPPLFISEAITLIACYQSPGKVHLTSKVTLLYKPEPYVRPRHINVGLDTIQ